MRRYLPNEVKRLRLRRLKKRYKVTAGEIGEVIGRHEVTVRNYLAGRYEIPAVLLEYAEYAVPRSLDR